MKERIIAVLVGLGFDMSSWEDSDTPQELSEEHIAKIETMQSEHATLTTENAQLKTALAIEKGAKEKAEGDLSTSSAAEKTSSDALAAAQTNVDAAIEELSIEATDGETLSDAIGKIVKVAGGKPGAVHSKSKSEGDDLNEEEKEIATYDHNREADEIL